MSEIVSSNPVNEATEKEVRTRSTFKLDYPFYQTMRFGEYCPHFVMEGIDSDKLPLHSSHSIKSYTLKAPLMSDLKINKDYFMVPMEAILPLNWSKWYVNPVKGQDVPNDCGPSVENFWKLVGSLATTSLTALNTLFGTSSQTPVSLLDSLFKFLVFFERLYSDGSLMANLGIHGSQFFRCHYSSSTFSEARSYDQFFDDIVNNVVLSLPPQGVSWFKIQYGTDATNFYYIENVGGSAPTPYVNRVIGIRDFLELLRDDFTWKVDTVPSTVTQSTLNSAWSTIYGRYSIVFDSQTNAHLDLRRLWSYQLVCWHYFSNDKVDYIFSADLFRQYVREVSSRVLSSGPMAVGSFTVNGLQYAYDALSAHVFTEVLTAFGTSNGIFSYGANSGGSNDYERSDNLAEAYAYFRALFGFNQSLRYKDYFTGSRTEPLAVGNTDIPVSSNLVNVIDVTRNIQKQRFLNAINRIPQQIEDYLSGLFHKRPAPDYHNPFFLARTTDDVFGQESEYTGNVSNSDANNITSLLRSQASRYAFEYDCDRECVIIGITSFDLERAYSRSIERQALHLTRFDGFNPYMQFIGDQVVYDAELGNDKADLTPFAYQLRHMEYKQRYAQCAGGFRKFLPGWLFIADDPIRVLTDNQDPSFIRSHNTELDRFYVSLTGLSLGSYFHFIVKNVNSMSASRPMAYAPSIL